MIIRLSVFLILITCQLCYAQSEQAAVQTVVYEALKSENLDLLNNALNSVEDHTTIEAQAYKGALLMKKAGLVKGAGKKLSIFKEGKDFLENSIHADSENAEYRFLRLMIQENAPAILGYADNLEEDVEFVANNYFDFNPVVQKAVKDYSLVSSLIVFKEN